MGTTKDTSAVSYKLSQWLILRNMKAIILTVVGIGFIGGIVLYMPNTTEFVQENTEVEITAQPEVVEVDVIDDAKAELERINQELDAEEARLDEQIAELQARKARIKEIRLGF